MSGSVILRARALLGVGIVRRDEDHLELLQVAVQGFVDLAELAGGGLEHPTDGVYRQLRSAEVGVLLLQVEHRQLAEADGVLGDDVLDRRVEELLLCRCELGDHLLDLRPLLGGEILGAYLTRGEAITPSVVVLDRPGRSSSDLVLSLRGPQAQRLLQFSTRRLPAHVCLLVPYRHVTSASGGCAPHPATDRCRVRPGRSDAGVSEAPRGGRRLSGVRRFASSGWRQVPTEGTGTMRLEERDRRYQRTYEE